MDNCNNVIKRPLAVMPDINLRVCVVNLSNFTTSEPATCDRAEPKRLQLKQVVHNGHARFRVDFTIYQLTARVFGFFVTAIDVLIIAFNEYFLVIAFRLQGFWCVMTNAGCESKKAHKRKRLTHDFSPSLKLSGNSIAGCGGCHV